MVSSSNNGSSLRSTDSIFQWNIVERKTRELHIVFLVTTGFAARMMLRTGITNRLRAEGAEVTVISPNADEPYCQEECKAQGMNLRQSPRFPLRIANRF